jgi:hypothetical protein
MSRVTDIILVSSIDDGGSRRDQPVNVQRLDRWLQERHPGYRLIQVDAQVQGPKAMQCDIFLGAVNYLDREDFLAAFHAIDWELPGCVQLMLKGEEEDVFTVYLPQTH